VKKSFAGNPNFAKLDEVLFIAGESSLRLAESKGKTKAVELTPDQLRDGARDYLTQLAVDHPNSLSIRMLKKICGRSVGRNHESASSKGQQIDLNPKHKAQVQSSKYKAQSTKAQLQCSRRLNQIKCPPGSWFSSFRRGRNTVR